MLEGGKKLAQERVFWQVFLLIIVNFRVLAPDSFLISEISLYKMSFFFVFFGFTKSGGSWGKKLVGMEDGRTVSESFLTVRVNVIMLSLRLLLPELAT